MERIKHNREKLSKEELTNLLKNQHALRYFKYNIHQYCELHCLIINEISSTSEYITFLRDEYTFQQVIRDRDQFYVTFLEIVFPTLIHVCIKFGESAVFGETSKLVQKVSSVNFCSYNK